MVQTEPEVTIVVVPRERFAFTEHSLESIERHTTVPHRVVYVDGKAPRPVKRYLERKAAEGAIELVRADRYLSPNQARNIGMRHVRTPWVVFVDNDIVATPNWLDALLACAAETGASIVGPLYLEGDPADRIIHMAGGDMSLDGEFGRRHFSTTHRLQGTAIDDAPAPLVREPCGFVEFHCLLVRAGLFDEIGPLDEELLNTREHLDLCLRAQDAGREVWFEPASHVTYATPPPLPWSDIPYFLLRWSDAWGSTSLDHFCAKHGIDPGYADRLGIMRARRQIVFLPLRRVTRPALGVRGDQLFAKVLSRVERTINRLVVRPPRPGPADVGP
jgi:GT2 family glycosyltransferase